MFSRSIRVARFAGIPIHVDASWLIIFFVVGATLTFGQFRPTYPHLGPIPLVTYGLGTTLLFFLSVLLHELAHSLVARFYGIRVRNITLFMLGGVSQIEEESARPYHEFAIAVAGPVCSLALAALAGLTWLALPPGTGPMLMVMEAMAGVNLVLAAFNMVPGYPLDGGRVFRSLIWALTGSHARATRTAAAGGIIVAYAFVAGGLALTVLWNGEFMANGLWLALIGWFLQRASSQSYRYEGLRAGLRGRTVAHVMDAAPPRVAPHLPLQGLHRPGVAPPPAMALVAENGDSDPQGVIPLRKALAAQRNRQDALTVAEAMVPLHRVLRFRPDTEALAALEHLDAAEAEVATVEVDGRIVGLISRDAIQQHGEQRQAA